MSAEDLSAEDLREYERINAWIYEARERFYEETKEMTSHEISELIHDRAERTLREFRHRKHERCPAGAALV